MSAQDLVLDTTDDIPQAMNVMSDVLEPQVLTRTTARFVIQNTGILSRDSTFQMQIVASADNVFMPLNTGIYSAIKRVDLMIGQQTIQSINSCALYKAITHSYDTPSYRNNYTRIMKGINTTLLQNGTNAVSTTGGANVNAGLLIPAGSTSLNFNPATIVNGYETNIKSDPNLTPSFCIKVGELFPLLDNIELPLFLIKDPVSIVFHLNEQDGSVNLNTGIANKGLGNMVLSNYLSANNPSTTPVSANIVPESFLLFADYLYYTDERMFAIEESLNASKGMSKIYTDVIQIVNTQSASSAAPAINTTLELPFNFQLPVSNYQVKNVFLLWNPNGDLRAGNPASTDAFPLNAERYNSLLGNYSMANSVKPYSVQFRVNDELIFPQPLVNDPLKAQEAGYVYGSPVNLHTGLYSRNGANLRELSFVLDNNSKYYPSSSGSFTFYNGIDANLQLVGNMHFLGVNISTLYGDSDRDTELINQKPIEVFGNYPISDVKNITYNNYAFIEVTKLFAVRDGIVQLYDSVAQIQVQ